MIYGLFWDRFCQVMHPAMVETRFIASNRDGPAVDRMGHMPGAMVWRMRYGFSGK